MRLWIAQQNVVTYGKTDACTIWQKPFTIYSCISTERGAKVISTILWLVLIIFIVIIIEKDGEL